MTAKANAMDQQVDEYFSGKREMHQVLEMTPEQLQTLRGRAQFFFDGEHDERALIMLEMLEELDRTDARPSFMAIDVLLRMGHSDAAKAKAQAISERNPNSADALAARAQVELALGEWASAAKTLGEVAKRDPSAKTEAGKLGRTLAAKAYATFEANR